MLREGKIDADALEAAATADLAPALQAGHEAAGAAAVAVGAHQRTEYSDQLVSLLDEEGLAGRAAAWALGLFGQTTSLLNAAAEGGFDARENGYFGLAVAAATGQAHTLADAMIERIDDEIQRAQSGKTSLGEQANRVLAIIGDERSIEAVQRITDADPYTDRFELQRQRKQVSDNGSDKESIEELTADWRELFADDLAPVLEAEVVSEAAGPTEEIPVDAEIHTQEPLSPEAAGLQPEPEPMQPPVAPVNDEPANDNPAYEDEPLDDDDLSEEERAALEAEAMAHAAAIDLDGFFASDYAADLDDQFKGLISQVSPMLQQICSQAVGRPLVELQAEEVLAVFLQVLPQALPPQYIQALLSPQAINALHKLFAWLDQQEGGEGQLIAGLRLVREQLQESVRSRGILGGPDYSEPEE